NGKLRSVDADRDAAGAGIDIVSCQPALTALVEFPIRRQRQGVRRNGLTVAKMLAYARRCRGLRTFHRAPRISLACRATYRRARPNRRPTRASARSAPAAAR